jgi:hypothetical protein
MSAAPAIEAVIAKAVRDARLPYKIAATYIAAGVPVEIAVKTIKKYRKDVARLRPRRSDAYSLLRDAIGIRAANEFFAQRAPAAADRRKFARARPVTPTAKVAASRRATPAEMWDEVIAELNKENGHTGPPIGGARILPGG